MTISDVISLVSVLLALAAILLTLWQNSLTRRATEAQVLLTLKELAKEANYIDGVAAIASLQDYSDFQTYSQIEPVESQKLIYNTVDFLNFVAHLVETKFLPRQTTWNFYFYAYRISNDKLLTWWLIGIRKQGFQRFTAFEKMCKRIGSISDMAIVQHEAKHRDSLTKDKR